jgi:co-chaperonin GroES (HSP10)
MVREANRYLEEVPIEKLHLLEDRILCRVIKKRNKVGEFIVYHYEYQVKTNIGRVLLLGQTYDGPLKPGDYVIFNAWSGREFQSPDETLILLRPDNVEAVIDRETD